MSMRFKRSFQKQRGQASILFALMVPGLFGVFALATDGARALQTSARLNDASEMAVLAIAGLNDENLGSGGSQVNKQLAERYIRAYLPETNNGITINVVKRECRQIPACLSVSNDDEYNEYQVIANTNHNTWFGGSGVTTGFGREFDVRSQADAKKVEPKAVDIVFIADYSGSMQRTIDGQNPKKNGKPVPVPNKPRRYKELARIIKEVTEELEKYNARNSEHPSRVSLAPFTLYTNAAEIGHWKEENKYCAVSQLKFAGGQKPKPDVNQTLDINATLNSLFTLKTPGWNKRNCLDFPYDKKYSMYYKDIDFTSNFNNFNQQISKFYPVGGTGGIEGIIRGAQHSYNDGINPTQLLIVLSDGEDGARFGNYFSQLNAYGVCHRIRDKIEKKVKQRVPSLLKVKTTMAAIGFGAGYSIGTNTSLIQCVGRDNVYQANSMDQVKSQILNIISQEIGTVK